MKHLETSGNDSLIRYKQEVKLALKFHQVRVETTSIQIKDTTDQEFEEKSYKVERLYRHCVRPTEYSETVFILPKQHNVEPVEAICHPDEASLLFEENTTTETSKEQEVNGYKSHGFALSPKKTIPRLVIRRRHSQPDYELMRDRFVHPEDRYQRRRSLGAYYSQHMRRISRVQGVLQTWQEKDPNAKKSLFQSQPRQSSSEEDLQNKQESTLLTGFNHKGHVAVEEDVIQPISSEVDSVFHSSNDRQKETLRSLSLHRDQENQNTIKPSQEEFDTPGAFFQHLRAQTVREMKEEEGLSINRGKRKPSVGQKRTTFWVLDDDK